MVPLKLSIIIVNYKVSFFTEQCLCSVERAIMGTNAEVIVVNNDPDETAIEYLRPRFPSVRFVQNTANTGFGAACNLAWKQAGGELILFLNPDTLIPEDLPARFITFLESHPETGAAGPRMIGGRGQFLPESKRSFPSPMVSFFKLSGLSALFPRSSLFNRYALGQLDPNQPHSVDVLAGACMVVRASVLHLLGGFDEQFFMYGEDIDLCFRIRQAGFGSQYLGDISILHFKGESLRKGSTGHVRMFYGAMRVFVKKHYAGSGGWFLSFFLLAAIRLRELAAFAGRPFRGLLIPLADSGLTLLSLLLAEQVWIQLINKRVFDVPFAAYAPAVLTAVFLVAAAAGGLYDRNYRASRIFLSTGFAVIFLLAVYSLLPESIRFSRGVILLGGLLSALFIAVLRGILVGNGWIPEEPATLRQRWVIGGAEAYREVCRLLPYDTSGLPVRIDPEGPLWKKELRAVPAYSELIFCAAQGFSYREILDAVVLLRGTARLRFHAAGSGSIVGSDSAADTGTVIVAPGTYRLSQSYYRRMKRMTDVFIAIALLVTAPVSMFFAAGRKAVADAWRVLMAHKTWIGYAGQGNDLPGLARGVFPVYDRGNTANEILDQADRLYARDYDWMMDIRLVIKNYGNLQ